jgi:hypothetical protein
MSNSIETNERLNMNVGNMDPNKRYIGLSNIRSGDLDNVIRAKIDKGFQVERIRHVTKMSGYYYSLIFSKEIKFPTGFEFKL